MTNWKEIQELIEGQELDRALEILCSIPEDERDSVEFLSIMGVLHTYLGQWTDAAKFLVGALEKNPNDIDNLYNLCFVSMNLQDKISFRACFDRLNRMSLPSEMYQQLAAWKMQLYHTKTPRKILMIAYYYPPLSGSGVFRSLKFSKYLHDYGWTPTVISATEPPNGWNFRDDSLVQEIPKDAQVIRIADPLSTGKLKNVNFTPIAQFQRTVMMQDPKLAEMYDAILKKGEKGLLYLLQFPHHDLYWTYLVAEYIRKNIDMSKYDVLYTTSGPYSSHLLGCYLHTIYKIPWVADYRDEWTGNPYTKNDVHDIRYQMLFRLENLLLHQADINITMAESLCNVYQHRFGINADKIVSITNGYDEQDFKALAISQSPNEVFTIVYSGLIYTQEQNIKPILKAIKTLIEKKLIAKEKIKLKLVGTRPESVRETVSKFGLQAQVEATGYVSHHAALQHASNGDLLLLLLGDSDKYQNCYSSKTFEYIRCRKQILALAPSHGVIANLFQNMGYGLLTQSTNQKQIQHYILSEYRKWSESKEPITYRYDGEWRFERSYLTSCLSDVLDSLQSQPRETDSKVYDDAYKTGGAGQVYHKHYTQSFYYPCWKKAMRYLLLLDRGTDILEVGCGAGQFANMLFDAGFYNYHGIDYSTEAIKLSKKNNPKHRNDFFVADAFRDPILEQPHGLVLIFEVLEHIQDDIGLLSRFPAGTNILLSVPNFTDPNHVRYFNNEEEIISRFQSVLEIKDIQAMPLDQYGRILFYVLGNRKGKASN